jgi:tRNA1Val (adenine37-N6)-methyltransferase
MSIFKFKQFNVDQTGCAMRINTDGVLLGALAQSENPYRILDIGTGTGVIALMMAQRFDKARVEAVEIDETASATARKNFQLSVFSNRLKLNHTAIEHFSTGQKFDLIISNPPYFVNDLKSAESKKGIARHTSEQFFDYLIKKVVELLSDDGLFWFVLPIKQAEQLVENGAKFGLYPAIQISLHSDKTKPEFRRIVGLGRRKATLVKEQFFIYEGEKIYTEAYRELLKPYFLNY